MITVADLSAWLVTLGITTPIADAAFVPPSPDRMVLIARAGGPGIVMERTFDRVAFAIRTRGLQRQYADAEGLAAQVDAAILGVVAPVYIGGIFVNDIDRLGAPPHFLQWDTAGRSNFIASYVIQHAL